MTTKELLPSGKHTATVIFFHGSGDSGDNLIQWIRFLLCRDFQSSYIKFIFPTAPIQPYSRLNGRLSKIWFDRKSIDISSPEDKKSIENIFDYVKTLIKNEMDMGIPLNRVIVGGYSMGGSLALYAGFYLYPNIAGVFTCSSFLNNDAMVFEHLKSKKNQKLPKLLYFHGKSDELVKFKWGRETCDRLKELGVDADFYSLENHYHEIRSNQLLHLEKWFHQMIPPLESYLRNKL